MWSEGPDTPLGYELILPPGWTQVPLDPTRRRAAIRTLVARTIESSARAAGTVAPDQLTAAKLVFARDLGALATQAAEGGAVDLYLFADVVQDHPVSAALLVTVVPASATAADPDALLDRLLRAPGVTESGVLQVAGRGAVRIRRTERTQLAEGGATLTVVATVVEYVFPVPYGTDDLLLTLSTPVQEVAEEFVLLFDAIVATLRWCWPRD